MRRLPARLGASALSLVILVTLTFVLVHLTPGGPAYSILGMKSTPQAVAALNAQLGLDVPLWRQYLIWWSHLLHGDLGFSFLLHRPVGELLRRSGRHPYRPAHIHVIADAPGFHPVTTHLFVEGSPYLHDDAVFGVKESLVRPVETVEDPDEAARYNLGNPFRVLTFDVTLAEREQPHAGGGLAPDAGQRDEKGLVAQGRAVQRLRQGGQDVLDPARLDLRYPAGADRLLDLLVGRVTHRLPAREALAQAQEGDIAVAVVGRLREDREDQLVEPVAVRRRGRDAVELTQPVADPAHARRGGSGPHRGRM